MFRRGGAVVQLQRSQDSGDVLYRLQRHGVRSRGSHQGTLLHPFPDPEERPQDPHRPPPDDPQRRIHRPQDDRVPLLRQALPPRLPKQGTLPEQQKHDDIPGVRRMSQQFDDVHKAVRSVPRRVVRPSGQGLRDDQSAAAGAVSGHRSPECHRPGDVGDAREHGLLQGGAPPPLLLPQMSGPAPAHQTLQRLLPQRDARLPHPAAHHGARPTLVQLPPRSGDSGQVYQRQRFQVSNHKPPPPPVQHNHIGRDYARHHERTGSRKKGNTIYLITFLYL